MSIQFRLVGAPFAGTKKVPNAGVRARNAPLPTLVFESLWTQSFRSLKLDADKWMRGSNGAVNAVILVNWARKNKTVRGTVELYTRRGSIPQQTEV
ncbi:hypothetical protein PHISCL_05606 [Aspergillus sclerotialis]|uniref:Uncharacterized protein n=1 Tax=Aspergillus sclerotialis TaxID=2070753 RepID=A0A3A2ZFU3_9EURO|nr:hypothetical protein PHISCL_05606 [Aspergillus sclerotialis]